MTVADIARTALEMTAKRTHGTWEWFGNTKMQEVYLATKEYGRRFVMDFARWGMRGAQPRFQTTVDGEIGGGIMRDLGEFGKIEHPLGPIFEVPYRRQFVGIGHPDAAIIPFAVNNLRALAETVLAYERVVEAAKEWRAFADKSPYGPRGDSALWDALDALRKDGT